MLSLITDDSEPKASSLAKLQKYFLQSRGLVQQETLEIFYAVCHSNDDLIRDLAHNFPSIRIAHRNNGLVEAIIKGKIKAAAITLNLPVEILNSLMQVFS
jgi:hypothetical protein